ncbi:MAG: ABC transporter ATP-binding protein [Flavobacteriales bacterium]|jgi:phospholipid/cholesterol/gamma-HCH transport system ATP-binding protein|tara:strand:- start:5070 stop:5819 length:750 start_codon:yes stop_codon:yes gene_type:complete
MIEVKNLYKSFGEHHVLQDISVSFEPGKINLIIGGSGSGKSVLTKCMVGLHEIDSGSIKYDGKEFTTMNFKQKKEIRKDIGMLFQASALFDSLTVEENVLFPLEMYTKQTRKEMLERVDFCLDRVNLENANKLYPAELSGGMKKRVGIARAIALNPKYLFCDEPNSGLDPFTGIVIDQLIQEITKEYNMTTIVITHDMNSVMETGENIMFLYQGKNWWQGDNNEIVKSDNKELSEFVFASKIMKQFRNA